MLPSCRLCSLVLVGLVAFRMLAAVEAQGPGLSLTVRVYDQTLRSPDRLDAADLEVRVDGQSRPVRSVRRAGPFSLLLLLDNSASMAHAFGPAKIRDAVADMLAHLRPDEPVRVAAFNTRVEWGTEFGAAATIVPDFLRTLSYHHATHLYDVLDGSLVAIARRPGRHVIIVVSDGADSDSLRSANDVLVQARHGDTQLWAVLPSRPTRGVKRTGPDEPFMQLVHETGGGAIQVKDDTDLGGTLSHIVQDVREQYAVDVDAVDVDRKTHRISVRSVRPGTTVVAPQFASLADR